VHGEWRGLHPDVLFEKMDLAVTTDYRDVLGEILSKRLAIRIWTRCFRIIA